MSGALWNNLVRPVLFRLDPERAHELARWGAKRAGTSGAILSLIRERYSGRQTPGIERRVWNLRFRNPLGLAAGFDKSAEMIPFLEALGFGFLEVGTVTLNPQKGDPKPRMFRFPHERAIVNRLGFNNEGAAAVRQRLKRWTDIAIPIPLFVNIGKNREVKPEDAPAAYRKTFDVVAPWADGVVVNVSSPNTPGLRNLQRTENLRRILGEIGEEREQAVFVRGEGTHPVLVKLSPDLDDEGLEGVVEVCRELADGIVATNTTTDHSVILEPARQRGGLSGAPLFARSTAVLRKVRELAGPDYPIVGVGGIMDLEDASAKLDAGADLIQIYTGMVYGGPGTPRSIIEGLAADATARKRI